MKDFLNHDALDVGRFSWVGSLTMGERTKKCSSEHVEHSKEELFDPVTAALRQMHDDIAGEAIPADFLALLDQIDAKMSASKKHS